MAAVVQLHSDEQLMQRLRNDDERALEILFKQYYTTLLRFACNIVKDKTVADDMVQEVMLKIWEKRHTLNINTSLKAYLYMAVKNHCLNQLKVNERKYWMEEGMEDDSRISVNDIVDKLNAKNLEARITEAIEYLPPKCSLIFKMSRYEGKSYKEIAEALELSVKTVENQIGKALMILRESLSPYMQTLSVMAMMSCFLMNIIRN
jgi:RNA polymerase sigma-70 factor (ECF subfamily)